MREKYQSYNYNNKGETISSSRNQTNDLTFDLTSVQKNSNALNNQA